MPIRPPRRIASILAAAAAAAALLMAGCSSSGSAGPDTSKGASAAQSILADPQVSADIATAEAELTANFKKDFSAAHPYASIKQAVQDTFPQGNLSKIEAYAVKTFSLKVIHPGLTKPNADRRAWINGIAKFAITQGGGAPSASPGTASIPGVQNPSPSASPS